MIQSHTLQRAMIACLPVLLAASSAAGALALVEDGRPRAQIVIGEEPPRLVRLAAEELQTYLQKISGAELPIGTAPDDDYPATIYVGRSPHTDKLGITDDGLDYGAFRIKSGPDYLVLFGRDYDYEPIEPWPRTARGHAADDQWRKITDSHWSTPIVGFRSFNEELGIWIFDEGGSLNAVYEYLRSLGVRWFMPGDLGEVVPEMTSIALPEIDQTVRPDYPIRFWIHGAAFRKRPAAIVLHERRQGVSSLYETLGPTVLTHGLRRILGSDAMKQAHPEYYAIVNGEPYLGGQGHACFSSEGFFDEVVRYARAVFDHYKVPMLQLSPADGFRHCECEQCAAQSSSTLVFGFIDRVAREVGKTHPDRIILAAGYTRYRNPPENIEQFSPNLAVTINNVGRPRFNDPDFWQWYMDLVEAWKAKLAPQRLIRVENTRYGSRPFPVLHPRSIARDLQTLKGVSLGERNELLDRRGCPAGTHLNLYVMGRYYWDADQDIEALLEEYHTLFYGPAAAKMKAAFDYAEAYNNSREGRGLGMGDAPGAVFLEKLLAARQALTGDDATYGKRIDLLLSEIVPGTEELDSSALASRVEAYLQELRHRMKTITKREEARGYRWWNLGSSKWDAARRDFKIDGKLDEAFWRRAARLSPANACVSMMLGWQGALVIGIRCDIDSKDDLKITTETDGDPAILDGEHVEILLETDAHSFYQLVVNPAGALLERDLAPAGEAGDWVSQAEVGAYIGDDYWGVEMKLPLARDSGDPIHNVACYGYPSVASPWHFNVIRRRWRDGKQEVSAFVMPDDGEFHNPATFGRLFR